MSLSDSVETASTNRQRSRPLRVALITGSYNYIKDGVALTLNRLVEHLESQGVEVCVIAPVAKTAAFPHEGTVFPVPSFPLPLRPEYRIALGLSRRARQKLDAFQPDIVHIATPDLLGYQALKYYLVRNVPVVASYHTRYETYLRHYCGLQWFRGLGCRYLRFFYNSCREVYAPSASMIELLRADGIVSPLRLWSRGVDGGRFHPDKKSNAWRNRQGLGDGDTVVLWVGRLVREKRLDMFVEALRELRRRGVAHRSLVVGDGPEQGWLGRQLREGIFTGALDGEDLARAYASADIFFFPSDSESFGNVTLEAMASGLPTVCADASGSRSLVLPGVTGFLAAPGRADEFAGHLRTLIEGPALRRRMGSSARERSTEFTWDAAMRQILRDYEEVVGWRSGPSS